MVESREDEGKSNVHIKVMSMNTDSGSNRTREAHIEHERRKDYQEEMDALAIKVRKDYRASSRSGSRSRAQAKAELEKIPKATTHAT